MNFLILLMLTLLVTAPAAVLLGSAYLAFSTAYRPERGSRWWNADPARDSLRAMRNTSVGLLLLAIVLFLMAFFPSQELRLRVGLSFFWTALAAFWFSFSFPVYVAVKKLGNRLRRSKPQWTGRSWFEWFIVLQCLTLLGIFTATLLMRTRILAAGAEAL
jgi:hypothetical protein